MRITVLQAEPKSSEGKILVENLYVNEKGQTEPVFIIRASEPIMQGAIVAALDLMKVFGYMPHVVDGLLRQLHAMSAWQQNAKGTVPRGEDLYVLGGTKKPEDVKANEVPKPVDVVPVKKKRASGRHKPKAKKK